MFRIAALVVPVFALAVAGCAPGKSDIEKSIKNEMKTGLGVEIKEVNLNKQADGGYTGTATAASGDVYEVVAQPPKGGRAEWKAAASQSMIEKSLREGIEGQTKLKVKSFQLTKQGLGVYSGTAELENGVKFDVASKMNGTQLSIEWKPQ